MVVLVVEEIEVEGCVREGGEVVKEEGQEEAIGAPDDDAWDQTFASLEQHIAKLEEGTTEGTRAMEEAVDGLAFDLRQAGMNMQSNIREGLARARDEHLHEPTAATCSHMDILLDASDGMRADIEAVAKTAKILPTHSWEYGSACEALLELHNPGTISSLYFYRIFPLTCASRILCFRREPLPHDRPRLKERGCTCVWLARVLRTHPYC